VSEKNGGDTNRWARYLMRIPVPWVFGLAYLLGALLEHLVKLHVDIVIETHSAGVAIFALGVIIALWAQILFRLQGTTTVPGEKSVALVTSGPYRLTRNPMYVALAMAYLGWAGILRQVWPLVFLPPVMLYLNSIVIPVEERRLREAFGLVYETYRSKVRRWV
jgi:protein-S-isoprenylcysteine O-methyltransferase Ste14